MSTISAGAGDDLISPGRGANLVLTGSGSDRILLDQNELFGDMTLMDFKKNEDKLILSSSVKYTGLGTNVLTVGDFTNSLKYKRLLLTGHSKEIWHQDDIEFL